MATANEIKLPRVFRELSTMSIAEQVPSITVDLPGKIFAVPSFDIDSSNARALQLYSHLHYGTDGLSNSKACDTVRYYGETVIDKVNAIPSDPKFVMMSEMNENLINAGKGNIGNDYVDDVFRKRFQNMGIADPTDTNQFRDYYHHDGIVMAGLRCLENPVTAFWNSWKAHFNSELSARTLGDGTLSPYFARGCHEFQNWTLQGYHDSWHRIPEHTWFYILLATLEQKYLAIRRKVAQFSWSVLDGSEWKLNSFGSMKGTRFESPAGIMYKNTLNFVPPQIMYRDGLLSTLVGDGQIHWNPASRDTIDIKRWVRSYNGGYATWKTKWKGDNMDFPVDYDYNNPLHPAKSPGDNPRNYGDGGVEIIPPSFGGPAPSGVHSAMAGRYMVSQIKNDLAGLRYGKFQFQRNGGTTIDGYYNGTNPVMGVLGNASVSTLDNRNFEQCNAINQLQYKLPILLVSDTKAIWCNPLARPNEVNHVTIDDGGVTELESIGPGIKVYNR